MKMRRITLAVLLSLTLLFIADVRYFGGNLSTTRQPSIHFNVGPSTRAPGAEKKRDFVRPQSELASLVIKGNAGVVELKTTDSEQIEVHTTISAENEHVLDRWEVVETISNSEISYGLKGGASGKLLPEVGVSYVVEVPAGMEVTIEQQFGEVRVWDFVGFLNLEARFSDVEVRGLQGSATISNSFGDVDLWEIAGPITLEDSYSTTRVGLKSIDGGYDFNIDITNGTLVGNAPLQIETVQNRVTGQGKSGEGLHPVVITSRFSTLTVDLD